jgi:hypothetical protein
VQPGAQIEANAVSTMLAPMTPTPMQLLRPDEPLRRSVVTGNIHQYVHLE